MDVDALLGELTGRQLLYWKAYFELEPSGEERADLRLASMLRMLFSIHRDSKETPEVPGLGDFYAGFLGEIQEFTDALPKRGIAKTQTWQHQKQILLNWAMHMAASQQAAELRAKRK